MIHYNLKKEQNKTKLKTKMKKEVKEKTLIFKVQILKKQRNKTDISS
jgi:hypothetical protein